MSVAVDTFADFVDHLAAALDEPDVTGAEWARRLHFSRFHFDRMISSVAGEPPQAFRRRVLFKGAPYRLVTTTAPATHPTCRPRRRAPSTSTHPAASGRQRKTRSRAWSSSRRWSSTTSGSPAR